MSHFECFASDYAEVPGWFSLESAALWDALLSMQFASEIRGEFLEIGVWKGKSAALSTLHARADECCVFVDMRSTEEAQRLLERIKPTGLQFFQMRSTELVRTPLLTRDAGTFRWIHIDGEHTGPAVASDLGIADVLLSEQGVVTLDDFLSPLYPQVTQAVFRWIEAHPYRLHLFLCGSNKAYLCRPQAARTYLTFVRDRLYSEMAARGIGSITIHKTTESADMNCFGIGPRMGDWDYRGPDWDPKRIEI